MSADEDTAEAFVGLADATASMLERAADTILTPHADLPAVAAVLRETATQYRAKARPPLLPAEVQHAAALLRRDDPRTVFPSLGADLAGGAR